MGTALAARRRPSLTGYRGAVVVGASAVLAALLLVPGPASADCSDPSSRFLAFDVVLKSQWPEYAFSVTSSAAPPGGVWRLAFALDGTDGRHVRRAGSPFDLELVDISTDGTHVYRVPADAAVDETFRIYEGDRHIETLTAIAPEDDVFLPWERLADPVVESDVLVVRSGGTPCVDVFPPPPQVLAQLAWSWTQPLVEHPRDVVSLAFQRPGGSPAWNPGDAREDGFVLDVWLEKDPTLAFPDERRVLIGVDPTLFSEGEPPELTLSVRETGTFTLAVAAVDVKTGVRSDLTLVDVDIAPPTVVQACGCSSVHAASSRGSAAPIGGWLAWLALGNVLGRRRPARRQPPPPAHRPTNTGPLDAAASASHAAPTAGSGRPRRASTR